MYVKYMIKTGCLAYEIFAANELNFRKMRPDEVIWLIITLYTSISSIRFFTLLLFADSIFQTTQILYVNSLVDL